MFARCHYHTRRFARAAAAAEPLAPCCLGGRQWVVGQRPAGVWKRPLLKLVRQVMAACAAPRRSSDGEKCESGARAHLNAYIYRARCRSAAARPPAGGPPGSATPTAPTSPTWPGWHAMARGVLDVCQGRTHTSPPCLCCAADLCVLMLVIDDPPSTVCMWDVHVGRAGRRFPRDSPHPMPAYALRRRQPSEAMLVNANSESAQGISAYTVARLVSTAGCGRHSHR